MPWKLQQSGNQYFVVDDKGKKYSDKPMPKWRAKKQLAALYSSETKAAPTKNGLPASAFLVVEDPELTSTWHLQVRDESGTLDHRHMGAAWAALHGGYRGSKYEGPDKQKAIAKLTQYYKSEEMPTPGVEKGFHVFKQADGTYRWVAISSSAFKDRDNEIVTAQALAEDVERADTTKDYGPLRWWHVGNWEYPNGIEDWETWKAGPGLDVGTCDFNMLHGAMLIESGTFKSNDVAEAISSFKPGFEISIGFSHPLGEPGESKQFNHIHRFERSLLPVGMASNLLTKMYIMKGESIMKVRDKLDVLVAILRDKPEAAKQILADAESLETAAKEAGLEFKELDDSTPAQATAQEETPSPEPIQEPVQTAEDTNIQQAGEEGSQPVPVAQEPITGEAQVTEPVGEVKAIVPAPSGEGEPDEIGDMSHADLTTFVTGIVKQLLGQKEQEAAEKQAGMDQLVADTVASLKLLDNRTKSIEQAVTKTQHVLDDLTDARPVGIKQLMDQRPTASADNVIVTAPTGPHIDDAFRQFSQGGR